MNELLLSFDTSTPRGSVALVNGNNLVAEICLDIRHRPHSDYILRYARLLMQESGISCTDLSGLCVVNGPGSFTGLRVGLATVQGLAQSLELPVYQLSSLLVLGYMYGKAPSAQYCLIDARKKELYGARLRWSDNGPLLERMFVMGPEDVSSLINARHASEAVVLIGEGADLYREHFEHTCEADLYFGGPGSSVPSAAGAAQLMLQWPHVAPPVSGHEIQALYVRASDAELQQQGK